MTAVEGSAKPRVSICIPTYNGAAFIAEAIRSVLSQSSPDFELLIVDDCSGDATVEIARSFADARIRVTVNSARLGIPGNWNRCLALARGKYVCLFHQDDIMLPDSLLRRVWVMDADPAVSFVHSAIEFLVEPDAPSPSANWLEGAVDDFVCDGTIYFRRLLFSNRICAPTVIMRRDRLMKIGEFDPQLGFACDYSMWLALCTEGRVGFISRPLLLYRWHQSNASHAYRFERGSEETFTARCHALRYYAMRTGRHKEAELLCAAVQALADAQRRSAELDRHNERQLTYIKELEQMRDKLCVDIQSMGKSWETQQAYIKELEQTRDKLWADVQTVGKSWEQQQAYIVELQQSIQRLEQQGGDLSPQQRETGAYLRVLAAWRSQVMHWVKSLR